MSSPEPVIVNVPLPAVALPTAATAPMSRVCHGLGSPPTTGAVGVAGT